MPSCIRLMPGLEDAVMARLPVAEAPKTMLMAASSLSAWMKVPADLRACSSAAASAISLAGVIG